MGTKLPILIIIPHGGLQIPSELDEYTTIDKFDILFSSDICANEIFSLSKDMLTVIDTNIARIFVDLDRPPLIEGAGSDPDGVIKRETRNGKTIFSEDTFPDELAVKNILKRHYSPFHQTIEKIIRTGEIRLIVECHTMMAVGDKYAPDPGKPRPIGTVCNEYREDNRMKKSCDDTVANLFLDSMKRAFTGERITVVERFSLNNPPFNGYILRTYGAGKIPMLRFSLSRALFFNEEHFSYDFLKVDELRIEELKKKFREGIERLCQKFF